eukprot:757164-Heterocapsa_arctica.AAC.1
MITYARPSKILNVHVEDVILPIGNGGAYRATAVVFGSLLRGLITKTGEQDDAVIIDDRCPPY